MDIVSEMKAHKFSIDIASIERIVTIYTASKSYPRFISSCVVMYVKLCKLIAKNGGHFE